MRLSRQLKDAKFEAEEQQAERARIAEALKAAESKIEKLEEDVTKLESVGAAEDSRAKSALAELHKSEEARVKAESARTKAAEEKAAAAQALDEAQAEIEKLRKRAEAAEEAPKAPVGRVDAGSEKKAADLAARLEETEHRLADSRKKLDDLGGRAGKLEADNDELAKKLRAVDNGSTAKPADGGEIKDKALEVYNSVNDVLAELRVNISVVRDEFDTFAGKNSDNRARTIRDAIEAAAGQTEDVKGVLRSLRELAEN
jgi:chromosome segregation ATPase